MSAAPEASAVSAVDAFVARWQHASGSGIANAQLFVSELARLLDLPQPDPARDDTAAQFSRCGAWKRRLAQIVDTLVALGRARVAGCGTYLGTQG